MFKHDKPRIRSTTIIEAKVFDLHPQTFYNPRTDLLQGTTAVDQDNMRELMKREYMNRFKLSYTRQYEGMAI